jgi:rod shape-determining protein MreD
VVPVVSIVIVFLLADFLLQRPPGLWTALVVLASESLRRRRLQMTEFPFLVEWGAIAGAVAGMVLAERVILWVLFADLPSLGLSLTQGIVTVAIYPVVVAVSKFCSACVSWGLPILNRSDPADRGPDTVKRNARISRKATA